MKVVLTEKQYQKLLMRINALERHFDDMTYFLNDAIRMKRQAELGKVDQTVDHLLP